MKLQSHIIKQKELILFPFFFPIFNELNKIEEHRLWERALTEVITTINISSHSACINLCMEQPPSTCTHKTGNIKIIQSSISSAWCTLRFKTKFIGLLGSRLGFGVFFPQKEGISCAFNTCCLLLISSMGLLWECFSSVLGHCCLPFAPLGKPPVISSLRAMAIPAPSTLPSGKVRIPGIPQSC